MVPFDFPAAYTDDLRGARSGSGPGPSHAISASATPCSSPTRASSRPATPRWSSDRSKPQRSRVVSSSDSRRIRTAPWWRAVEPSPGAKGLSTSIVGVGGGSAWTAPRASTSCSPTAATCRVPRLRQSHDADAPGDRHSYHCRHRQRSPVLCGDRRRHHAHEDGVRRSQAAFRIAILDPELTLSQPRVGHGTRGHRRHRHAVESVRDHAPTPLSDRSPARRGDLLAEASSA